MSLNQSTFSCGFGRNMLTRAPLRRGAFAFHTRPSSVGAGTPGGRLPLTLHGHDGNRLCPPDLLLFGMKGCLPWRNPWANSCARCAMPINGHPGRWHASGRIRFAHIRHESALIITTDNRVIQTKRLALGDVDACVFVPSHVFFSMAEQSLI